MSRRVDRMRRLQRLAATDERQARRELATAQQGVEGAQSKLAELEAYHREYAASQRLRSEPSALRWQDHHAFLERLKQAIGAQRQLRREADIKLQEQHQRWLKTRQRVRSLEAAVERFQAADRAAEERLQQKRADEIAQSMLPRFRSD